jgi:hypothetical protein
MLREAMFGLLVGGGLSTAWTAEPTGTLTLACEGTTTLKYSLSEKTVREPLSMSIIIDFGAWTDEYFQTRMGKGWEESRLF